MRICFFCKTNEPEVLERNEFYRVDLRILRDLGYDVHIQTSVFALPRADIYFVWWWTWAFVPLIWARIFKAKAIIVGTFDHVMADGSLQYYPKRPWWHRLLIRVVLRFADANVVVSEDQRDYLATHFKVRRLRYSPHVIDTHRYQPSGKRDECLLVLICWLHGKNAERKCVAEAIEAMKTIADSFPKAQLRICGDRGPPYQALRTLVDNLKLGENVLFEGAVSTERKIELLSTCTVYLQPTRAEGFGVAILEAMACGAAIVTSPVGPVPGIVKEAGVYVNGSQPREIALAAIELLQSTDRRVHLGHLAHRRACDCFGYDRRRADFAALFSELEVSPSRFC